LKNRLEILKIFKKIGSFAIGTYAENNMHMYILFNEEDFIFLHRFLPSSL